MLDVGIHTTGSREPDGFARERDMLIRLDFRIDRRKRTPDIGDDFVELGVGGARFELGPQQLQCTAASYLVVRL